jgi:flavorubredoxin
LETLFQSPTHRNVVFSDLTEGAMVQANQHLVISDGAGLLLDPGGHKVYTKLIASMAGQLSLRALKHLFFSHQDPDIVAAANGWLMMTDAQAHLSDVWMRFLPHFGVDDLVLKRVAGIPDKGATLLLGGTPIKLIPAHFLHSPGNFQVWDPAARILYTGDLGASVGVGYVFVEDFDRHVPFMEGFHRRYMPSPAALRAWAWMARELDPDIIAPQHGALFRGKELCGRFIDWIEALECGPDLLKDNCTVP